MTDRTYMERALELAGEAASEGEVPVGAVVVRSCDGLIIGEGRNRRERLRDPLAHAEMEAIHKASEYVGGWRLEGCVLYVTLEPCPMCAGAVINSRPDRIVFGAYDPKAGSCGSAADIFSFPYNHHPVVEGGFMEEECSAVLKNFFREMRKIRMDPVRIIKAETDDQLKRIALIADEIWHEFFPCILSEGQIDYMAEKFCSFDAMKKSIAEEGYIYYFIKKDGRDIGYTAVKHDGESLFLSKIYLKKEERGKKYARAVMEQHKKYAREQGLTSIHLTVNKHNLNSIAAYKAMGFVIDGEGVADIGSGYVMDDYFMRLFLDKED